MASTVTSCGPVISTVAVEMSISNNVNHVLERLSQAYIVILRNCDARTTYLAQIRTISMLQPRYDTCIYPAWCFSPSESVVVNLTPMSAFIQTRAVFICYGMELPISGITSSRKIQLMVLPHLHPLPTRPNLRNSERSELAQRTSFNSDIRPHCSLRKAPPLRHHRQT